MALEQIKRLISSPDISTRREGGLMLVGYNQALLDHGILPPGWTEQDMAEAIREQKVKLGINDQEQ